MGEECLSYKQTKPGEYGIPKWFLQIYYLSVNSELMAHSEFEFLNFDDTETAFGYKSDKELKRVHWLFRIMNNSTLVALGSAITPTAIKLNLPFVKSSLKPTIFKQFVGGESLLDSQKVIDLLRDFNTLTILDYGAESKTSEEELDAVVDELVRGLELAASNDSVPVVVTKLTGLADNALLEKMQTDAALTPKEAQDKQKLLNRLTKLCDKAHDLKVSLMIDAEESWIQETIDEIANDLMSQYNKDRVVIFNTYQLYRHDKLDYLKASYENAEAQSYLLGAKLVRGAYMDKENDFAQRNSIESVIHKSKADTDIDYDKALTFCAENHEKISSVCASHNAKSTTLLAHFIEKKGIARNHPHLNFCQLFGMSDNLTFNLAKAGYNTAKYVPYGPIKEVVPYLIRRAKENSSVTNDMSRELSYLTQEIKRRGL